MLPLSPRKPARPPWASTPRPAFLHRVTAPAPSDPRASPAPGLASTRAFCQTLQTSASPWRPHQAFNRATVCSGTDSSPTL